jgi:2-amino-4-hydroxy-6-hydroxymethyldihydropteridine diphosphokinase
VRVALGLGSNLGDPVAHFAAAIAEFRSLGTVEKVSPYYRTAPIGGPDQDDYLNAVVLVQTTLSPRELLAATTGIEASRGRIRGERWGPRTLDIDILLYGDQTVDEPGLTVPHPRMTERRFVLAPLLDVWPDAALPGGRPAAELIGDVSDQEIEQVALFKPTPSWAAPVLFLLVGLVAVALWWIGDWLL